MASKKQLAEGLAAVPLFERCTKRDLRTVARHAEVVTIPASTDVVTEGDDGETFFLVLAGELIVTQEGQQTAVLGPNDHFGELALLDPAPRSATVTARTDVELAVLSVRMFRVLLRDMPQISAGMLGSLAAQLREARAGG
ncbi:MAG: cyclic nucleotide-binding domain-containing protein [Acidimicrobiia bacterium]|nr:cyclic nucleotide-binding domain-containing protein [Acidimicrobiia bacterium]